MKKVIVAAKTNGFVFGVVSRVGVLSSHMSGDNSDFVHWCVVIIKP